MMHKAWCSIFQGNPSNVKVKQDKKSPIWTRIEFSGLLLQFEFTHGFEMMRKAWCRMEEVACCFPRSPIKFQFWPELSVSRLPVHFVFNNGFEMLRNAWCIREEVPHYFSMSFINF